MRIDAYNQISQIYGVNGKFKTTQTARASKTDKVETVKAALEAYRKDQVENGFHYPMNVPKVQASEVVVYGDYVVYIMLGTTENMDADEATLLKEFQAQNQLGKAAIEEMLTK